MVVFRHQDVDGRKCGCGMWYMEDVIVDCYVGLVADADRRGEMVKEGCKRGLNKVSHRICYPNKLHASAVKQ